MFQPLRSSGTAFILVLLCALPCAAAAATSPRKPPAAPPDVASDFAALARQRPWNCGAPGSPAVPLTGWQAEPAQCAWQNRLQMRRWSGQGGMQPGACVSAQARWWTWARGRGSAATAQRQGWRTAWHAQSLHDDSRAVKRIVIIRSALDGQWSATEWRWDPSPRGATRRWQQERWALLLARAAQLRAQPEPEFGAREARMLRTILEGNLGGRPGEIASNVWQWQVDGLCLRVDAVGLDPQQLQLPYSVDDSRLEQRAAMQLQLARRYPKATWLTAFRLAPAPPHVRSGAKFFAVWLDHGVLKGQLWMPTKGDGPLVRVRIDAMLPAPRGGRPGAQALARAGSVMEHELTALALRWAYEHE